MKLLSELLRGRRIADSDASRLLSRYVTVCLEEPEDEVSYDFG